MKKSLFAVLPLFLILSGCSGGGTAKPASSAAGSEEGSVAEENTAEVSEETENTEEEVSLITITGIYYGEITSDYTKENWKSAQGMSDCIVTFEFTNDAENRTMPDTDYADCKDVTLAAGPNSYNAFKPLYYIPVLTRYSDFSGVLGYGNVLGGADPIKMFAAFFVNPNDLKEGNEITLNVDGITATADGGIAKQITYPVEILDDEDSDVLTTADLLVRLDTEFVNFEALANKIKLFSKIDPGSDMVLMSGTMKTIFDEDLGIILTNDVDYGGNEIDGRYYNKKVFSTDRKGFDYDAAVGLYPEIKDNIDAMIEAAQLSADAMVNTGTTKDGFQKIADQFSTNYDEVLAFFGLGLPE